MSQRQKVERAGRLLRRHEHPTRFQGDLEKPSYLSFPILSLNPARELASSMVQRLQHSFVTVASLVQES